MRTTIGLFAYLAAGYALLASIGTTRLKWDEPPTRMRRAITVAAWPAILAMIVAGTWDSPAEATDEGVTEVACKTSQ